MKATDARVLLTGATGGIGREVASALLAAGARVLLAGRSSQALANLRRALREQHDLHDDQVAWVTVDLRSPAEVERLAGHAAAWPCNVLVHGAYTAQRALEAGVLDELQIHQIPVLFGGGRRLFEVLSSRVELEIVRVVDTPEATHIRYRVRR